MEKKFNYQIVFLCEDDNRIIFVGTTSRKLTEILADCTCNVNCVVTIENILYQPVNSKENEEKES